MTDLHDITIVDELPDRVIPQRDFVVKASGTLDHGMQLYETPSNTPLCSRRCKTCSNCGRRYTKEEFDVFECPDCSYLRLCRVRVTDAGNNCAHHGGRKGIQEGIASGSFSHRGRMSHLSYLDGHLRARVKEGLDSTELLSVQQEISVAWARWTQLLENVSDGHNLSLFDDLESAQNDLDLAIRNDNDEDVLKAHRRMRDIIKRGATLKRNWDEINEQMEVMAKLKKTDSKLMKDAHQMISVERADMYLFTLVQAMRDRIQEVIIDPEEIIDPEKAAGRLVRLVALDYHRLIGDGRTRPADATVLENEES